MSKWKVAGLIVAAIAVTLSLINASWLAPRPQGRLLMVADGGVKQQVASGAQGDCTASRISKPEHIYLENTLPSIQRAYFLGADVVAVDVQRTKDGQMVAFGDAALECPTNGKGRVRDLTLAELKRLDVGYGYSSDGGKTHPLRGRIGAMPSVEEVLRTAPNQRLLFHFQSGDAQDADALAAAFGRAGLPIHDKISFYGPRPVLERMRRHAPKAWMFDPSSLGACRSDYLKWGWSSLTPASCRSATVLLPLDEQWTIWGWPNRFLARMAEAGATTILTGDLGIAGAPVGIERPEQLNEVPRSFRGYLWVEDIYEVGPALQR